MANLYEIEGEAALRNFWVSASWDFDERQPQVLASLLLSNVSKVLWRVPVQSSRLNVILGSLCFYTFATLRQIRLAF